MSCEESYLAIQRYLTDEREPYAPGTNGNTKRKIRKAAACYIVRNGILYYQRRQKGLDEFTELEVVLQAGRRKELIDEAHITSGGEHLNQHQTWETISQKYWWRGILKQVKDYIRECSHCQSKQERGRGNGDDVSGQTAARRPGRRRTAAAHFSDEEEDEEEDDMDGFGSSAQAKTKTASAVDKHELVFVDSKGVVKQFLPKHGQTTLDKLNQQRLGNQFCDITLLIEGEEHRAHKAVLAACSDYFYELFVEKGAVSSHEAVVDLSGFSKASFLPLLEFAYTSQLTFNFCVMAEVATLARHLLMAEVLQICESVHRQVEEQKLMVYQRGDVHTVVSAQPAPASEDPRAYVVTVQSDGQALVTHTSPADAEQTVTVLKDDDGTAETLALLAQCGQAVDGEAMTVVTHSGQAGSAESLAVVAHSGEVEAGETMTVVTHSGQAGSGESLAVVQACWSVEEPQVGDTPSTESMEPGAFLINVDPGRVAPTEVVHLAASAPPAVQEEPIPRAVEPPPQPKPTPPPAPPRRRGRPPKVKQAAPPVEEPEKTKVEEVGPAPEEEMKKEMQDNVVEGPNRRSSRKRFVGEGGYVRLHMGLESEEEEEKKGTSTVKVTQKRGEIRKGRLASSVKRRITDDGAEAGTESVPDGVKEDTEGAEPAPEEAGPAEGEPESAVDGEHACNECGMVFLRRYSLIMHTLKHEKSRGYKCTLCNKEFQYAASLRAHLARHKHQKSQRAPMSKASAEDSAGSEGQAKGRTKREFVCDICGKTLPKLYSLRIHMLNHTGVRPHACRACGKTFATKHSLRMHKVLHDATKRFHCSICDKTFVSKRSLEEHTSIHTGESKYLCTTCGMSFHRASGLSKHLKKHQPRPEVRAFACSHCDKSFYEAKDLQQHMNKHLGLKPFQCQVCGKCYSWKKDWYSHVKSHSVAEPYKCNVCGKEFYEKALFRRHIKKATHGKKGRVKQNLERECEHCGRKFTQLREYRRHMNNHQGVKPFECLTCGVAWADARSLKRHVRTHTGERPYVCPLCQEAHIDARTLRKHMSKYHGDQLPGKIMLEKDTLQFHNQGTQVEHAVSLLPPDLPPELRPTQAAPTEEIETVLITEETVEAMGAVQAVSEGTVTTLSDQSIMQVVNYVLAQQAGLPGGAKMEEAGDIIQTMEVEVAHVAEVAEVE
ncbi:zinc finger and BTB domain-containing protein 11 isoform X2 [Chanos chanos]|uniref:Zinc finger and BTB domain-containing protein 11 isoform X2 n=1 Tax=Chanos chanos TaxID=29144 RepID=A0A6J2WUA8_CHACN|nr:zinc finger and BTB domain-containing protein 11-like isoform X2 [Chanos chanos]